ncbi:MAG: leucine-rich repeat domain-containing protein, partial [Verrucomicrobiaceae bacterium]
MIFPNFLATAAAVIAITSAATHWSEADTFGDFGYTDNGASITINEHINSDKSGPVVVPATINGKPVTVIGYRAFWRSNKITSVTLPAGLISVESFAFRSCSTLHTVTFGPGLVSVGDNAFWLCSSLTNVNLPEGLVSLGTSSFWGCRKLKSIHLPSTLTHA